MGCDWMEFCFIGAFDLCFHALHGGQYTRRMEEGWGIVHRRVSCHCRLIGDVYIGSSQTIYTSYKSIKERYKQPHSPYAIASRSGSS
jgi:hypothetical protein